MSSPYKRELGLSGLNMKSLKKYPGVIPIWFFLGCGMGLAGYYLTRLALYSPEVTWNRKTNPEPWNYYSDKQYKFIASGRDYTKGTEAPDYKK